MPNQFLILGITEKIECQIVKTTMSIIHDICVVYYEKCFVSKLVRSSYIHKNKKNYGVLFAQVTTVNVLTAEPTIPAKIDPSMAWFKTISGSILPSHDTAFGTIRYPAEPIVKPIAQKIRIASALDIVLHASETCSSSCAIHRCVCNMHNVNNFDS